MGVISFSDKPSDTWQVAGWAFRQILDDTSQIYPDDHELREVFEMAKVYDGLSIEDLPPQMAHRITAGLRQIATGVAAGTFTSGLVSKSYGDAAIHDQYKGALQELLHILPARHDPGA